ncbi:MAG: hypothetical protein KAK02_09175 [Desulfobulbaceae bacterium]|nr:hypothetical protein [Desulfobulbaceae bacterium]
MSKTKAIAAASKTKSKRKPKTKPLFSSGLDSFDKVLQGVLAGDNVVWQVDDIKDQIPFVHQFCRRAQRDGKKMVYFRFAQHEALMPEDVDAEIHILEPRAGFEKFISEILTVITASGQGACFVFDSLSGLAVDWYSDRMLGNFFKLACPYLYLFDTVAYFVLLRNSHTPLSINAIHDTAQIVLDLYCRNDKYYILPLKVLDRYTPTMYMLHALEGDKLKLVTRSTVVSEILSSFPHPWVDCNFDQKDTWVKTFSEAQALCLPDGKRSSSRKSEALRKRLIKMVITRDKNVFKLCEQHFELSDLISIGKRMIGTGLIGGKATGMLLARAILKNTHVKWKERLEIHDSFYVGADVFYTFVINNKCWWERHHMRSADDPFAEAEKIKAQLLQGKFPRDILEQFKEILNYFGQTPIIVRSSSLLEDAYGNAFSGKYESVFCANQGTPEERLEKFKDAVRTVYASTMGSHALAYRIHRGLFDRDEQMALLVQRVSGSFYENLYLPQLAGVGYSFNPFVWDAKIDPSEGVLRLVFGLGTRAVDRHDDDYTRIVALSAPLKQPKVSSDDISRYSQRIVDVLDLKENRQVSTDFETVTKSITGLPLELFAVRDNAMEERAVEYGVENVFSWILTFKNVFKTTALLDDMREILRTLDRAYEHPVDIEFTVNFCDNEVYKINLLQCRPFQVKVDTLGVKLPRNIKKKDIVLKTQGPIIGEAVAKRIDRIIYVVPSKYSTLTTSERFSVARLIGDVTNHQSAAGQTIMLIGPGRWGTKMPELGVPVSFSEIKNVSVLCELATMHDKLKPDISLGTHFFNDIVEMGIVYMGLYPDNDGYFLNEGLVLQSPNALSEVYRKSDKIAEAIHVADLTNDSASVFMHSNTVDQEGIVFLDRK